MMSVLCPHDWQVDETREARLYTTLNHTISNLQAD